MHSWRLPGINILPKGVEGQIEIQIKSHFHMYVHM